MAADEIMHHVYEVLNSDCRRYVDRRTSWIEHQEHVSALGVRDALVGLGVFGDTSRRPSHSGPASFEAIP